MPWQCRFVSVDPLAGEYPFYTPYQYAGNKPIVSIDIDGLEAGNDTGSQPDGGSNPQQGSNNGSLWSRLSKAAKAQANGTENSSDWENVIPKTQQEASSVGIVLATETFLESKEAAEVVAEAKKILKNSSKGSVYKPPAAAKVIGLTAVFVLIPLETSSSDTYISLPDGGKIIGGTYYPPVKNPDVETLPDPKPLPDNEPNEKPKPEPKNPKEFKMLLGTIGSNPNNRLGHSAVGLSDRSGNTRWFDQRIIGNFNGIPMAEFEELKDLDDIDDLMDDIGSSGGDILSYQITQSEYLGALSAARSLETIGAKPYNIRQNSCVTNCKAVFYGGGFSPEGSTTVGLRNWFSKIGAW
jgi:hypothetical protein